MRLAWLTQRSCVCLVQLMDQQLDTMLFHTGRYSSQLAKRLQDQEAAVKLHEPVPGQLPHADQSVIPSQAHASPGAVSSAKHE